MVHVVDSQVLENCLDSSVVKEIWLSEPVGEMVMRRMARQGKLQFFPDFPRPYFRIDRSRTYVVQGVFDNTSVRVTFSPLADVNAEEQLKAFIETPLLDQPSPQG
ncbi:MAG: hypothetical protein JXA93_11700 [Anaerolineae bacterium]|nr:hypothetical protein [Anaerolineae bacterium]